MSAPVDEETAKTLLPRYSRQMLVPALGSLGGQEKLQGASVVVVGAGGIGSTVLMYLAGAGIGRVEVMDFDIVEVSNLHRQIIHDSSRAGTPKADSALSRMAALNPMITCTKNPYGKLTTENAIESFKDFDVVVDATDNFESRYIINDACVLLGKPLVSGSAVGLEGQITVFAPRIGPCYRCLYPSQSLLEGCRSCANAGVLGPVPGLIGCLQAVETIKVILSSENIIERTKAAKLQAEAVQRGGADGVVKPSEVVEVADGAADLQALIGRQTFYDASTGEFHNFTLPPRSPTCAVCSPAASIKSMADCKEALRAAAALATAAAPPTVLPDEVNVSVTVYHNEVCKKGVRHVLLDVRSDIQFNMISFDWYRTRKFPGSDTSRPESLQHLHIPLKELKKAVSNSNNDSNSTLRTSIISQSSCTPATPAISQLLSMKKIERGSDSSGHSDADAQPIYVLCRRGIDSRSATRLLLDAGYSHVYNIEGGLTAWQVKIDPDLPMY